ncbi:MAG: toll/interleukin-1 receptor domain-containing protein [Sphingomicrobium sp.]
MSRVFLSYDHDDAARARTIALALEEAGHSVWWDLHVRGGAQYSKVIEEALDASDAVVVLWSAQSVESAWVRDEAATARDSGRLVPVRLDGTAPPLGFRQYQTIDLSRWKARAKDAQFQILLTAIGGLAEGQPDNADMSGSLSVSSPAASKPSLISMRSAGAIAVAAVVLIAMLLWQPWRAQRDAPMVAVVAARPGAVTGALASDLLIKLGVLQSSHADSLQLVDVNSPQTPDFLIKVSGTNVGKGAQASLMLVDNRTGTLFWSREFTDPTGNEANLRQQMAYSAAQVLDCAVQALSTKGRSINLPTLKLYLSGCADLSNLLAQDPKSAIAIFLKVTEQAPEFPGGWKRLLLADFQALRLEPGDEGMRDEIRKHIAQARRLDPAMAEAFLGETWLQPPRPVIGWMKLYDLAVASDPDNPEILASRSIALTNVGLLQQSLADARRAVTSNPLSPIAREALITALLNTREVDAARAELAKAEQLWPGTTKVLQSRFAVEFREGNPALALRMMQSGELGPMFTTRNAYDRAAHESFLQARIHPSTANGALAVVNARTLYQQDPYASWVYVRALSEFGRHEELISFLLSSDARFPYRTSWVIFRPDFSALHQDPRFIAIANKLGVLDYWQTSGKWPDFCGQPDLPYDCKVEAAKLAA